MAATTLTRPDGGRDDTQARLQYGCLREKMNQAHSIASVLFERQQKDTHEFNLAQLLDSLMADAKHWNALDDYFGVDNNGDPVEVQHG